MAGSGGRQRPADSGPSRTVIPGGGGHKFPLPNRGAVAALFALRRTLGRPRDYPATAKNSADVSPLAGTDAGIPTPASVQAAIDQKLATYPESSGNEDRPNHYLDNPSFHGATAH